ncbi:MAG: hypothetical protein V8Q99_17175 [Bacteroides ovatus]
MQNEKHSTFFSFDFLPSHRRSNNSDLWNEKTNGSFGSRTLAAKTENGVFISWRVLGNEKETAFNVYKNGKFL